MLFSTNHTNSDPAFTFNGEVIKPTHACRYLGVQIDSNLTFENHLNHKTKTVKKVKTKKTA